MKRAMCIDFITVRKALGQLFILALVMGVCIGYGTSSLMVAAAGTASAVAFSFVIQSFSIDAMQGWERCRVMLPFSRKELVGGRYLSLLVFSVGMAALVSAVAIALTLIVQGMGVVVLDSNLIGAGEILLSVGVACALILIVFSVAMPVYYKFGMTRGSLLLPMLLIMLFVVIPVFMEKSLGISVTPFMESVLSLVGSAQGIALLLFAMFALVAVAYFLSFLLSYRLYSKKDF